MTKQMTEQESKQQAFDQATLAYVSTATQENDHREQNAWSLDTDNTFTPDTRFDFATPNWNDTLVYTDIFKACGRVSETLKSMPDARHPQDVIHDIRHLLNASFSHGIKTHIVMLVADTETIEGACWHCFGLYGEDSRSLDNTMTIWRTLTHVLAPPPSLTHSLNAHGTSIRQARISQNGTKKSPTPSANPSLITVSANAPRMPTLTTNSNY